MMTGEARPMTVKEQLHQIVEGLPEERLEHAKRLLLSLEKEEADRPLGALIDGLSDTISPEEWQNTSTDLAAQIDHYAYGLPKR
jgi:hypothetical protein